MTIDLKNRAGEFHAYLLAVSGQLDADRSTEDELRFINNVLYIFERNFISDFFQDDFGYVYAIIFIYWSNFLVLRGWLTLFELEIFKLFEVYSGKFYRNSDTSQIFNKNFNSDEFKATPR